ncbi:MAG: beta-lactamase family protein [Opitutaceae bacterium]|nr:beta-lactamase family protein [Opitutaceae bacterium]
MQLRPLLVALTLSTVTGVTGLAAPQLPGIGAAMQAKIDQREISGAVTVVLTRDKIVHLESTGVADLATRRPIAPDSLFWIASMSKPITGVAVLLLQDEGKLNVNDPVAKFIPEFAQLKTPSGKPANLTITQILTHTSGLGEAPDAATLKARSLADLVPVWLGAKMTGEPGAQWRYCQSGINLAGRIVEVVSGLSFDAFLQQRLFAPLGMKDTTFYPTDAQKARLAIAYLKNKDTGALEVAPPRATYGHRTNPPQGNGGLFSTPADYARFCQLLLNRGTFGGKRILSEQAFQVLTSVHTGDLPTGFFQAEAFGRHGTKYGWGIGTCILKTPHDGPAAMLSPGTFGHGGAWGTQAWIDPVKGVAYLLMVQRANFPNSDASGVRQAFQEAAAAALTRR